MQNRLKGSKNFVDFYDSNQIMPVTQDLKNPMFQTRRKYLYRSLGIPLQFIKNMTVLEFGPGGGFNAHALSQDGPLKKYVCVEGSKVGQKLVKESFQDGKIKSDSFEIAQCDFLEFHSKEEFNLVIAEGCIPGQIDPRKTLKHISSFVEPSGYLVVTFVSRASQLSELLRSVYSSALRTEIGDDKVHESIILKEFEKHLRQLGTFTRSVEDWVADNITQNLYERVASFSLFEGIQILHNFEFVHSNPQFIQDLDWYKSYVPENMARNKKIVDQYSRFDLSLLDIRIQSDDISKLSDHQMSLMHEEIEKCYLIARNYMLGKGDKSVFQDLQKSCKNLSKVCAELKIPTYRALNEFADFFNSEVKSQFVFDEVSKWWGRGQQYATFFRIR